MRAMRLLALIIALSAGLGCARGLHGPSINTPITPAPRSMDELTVEERRSMLDRAQVWEPIDTEELNLLRGPEGDGNFEFDASVTCTFDYPDKPLGGATPKFDCALKPKDIVKVKFGMSNGEVFAEVAASRLFWALGFFADRMYPVQVTCLHCPPDPYRASTVEWALGRPGNLATRVFDPAAIERKFDGKDIEVPTFEGWSWRELEDVADNGVGAPRAQIDALKLLAAFIQHVDSKPENQALVCADGAVGRDEDGNATCERPLLLIKDLGSAFAAASRMRFVKMSLASWRSVGIWRDARACRAELISSFIGTLAHPLISEAGRQFLAERLSLLSDDQIRDMFAASRVERRNEMMDGRRVTLDDWVRVFKAKRDQIVNHSCPSGRASRGRRR
ncbi:MAG TPA: hypothetical protein VMO26_13225 [Vicinamibacterales bacterium]|nr:hypothetical protein [Vicinamibacterales bacterium]